MGRTASVCIHLMLVFYRFISVSSWVQVFHNVSGQFRFEPAVAMSRRREAIEELRRSTPDPSCKPVRTILDPRGNASSIKSRDAATAYAQHQWPQYSLLPASGISTRRTRLDHDPSGERLTPYNKYFPDELFEGAIRGYLLNVYCRKLRPLFM